MVPVYARVATCAKAKKSNVLPRINVTELGYARVARVFVRTSPSQLEPSVTTKIRTQVYPLTDIFLPVSLLFCYIKINPRLICDCVMRFCCQSRMRVQQMVFVPARCSKTSAKENQRVNQKEHATRKAPVNQQLGCAHTRSSQPRAVVTIRTRRQVRVCSS